MLKDGIVKESARVFKYGCEVVQLMHNFRFQACATIGGEVGRYVGNYRPANVSGLAILGLTTADLYGIKGRKREEVAEGVCKVGMSVTLWDDIIDENPLSSQQRVGFLEKTNDVLFRGELLDAATKEEKAFVELGNWTYESFLSKYRGDIEATHRSLANSMSNEFIATTLDERIAAKTREGYWVGELIASIAEAVSDTKNPDLRKAIGHCVEHIQMVDDAQDIEVDLRKDSAAFLRPHATPENIHQWRTRMARLGVEYFFKGRDLVPPEKKPVYDMLHYVAQTKAKLGV